MRSLLWLSLGVLVLCLAARGNSAPSTKVESAIWRNFGASGNASAAAIDVVGLTQRAPGHKKKLVPIPGTSFGCEIDAREVVVRCDLSRLEADALSLGQPVELQLAENSERLSPGRLIYIAPVSDPRTRQVTLFVRLQNRDRRLRVGTPISAHFPVDPSLVD